MLIPYVEIDGVKTVSYKDVIETWHQLVKDGTNKVVFHDDGVSDEKEFYNWISSPQNLVIFIVRENKIMGVAWINGIAKNYAFAHFALFKEAFGKHTMDIGKECLDYWTSMPGDDGPLLEVILGMIPEFNQKALHYIDRLGFKRVGRIPKIINHHGNKEAAILSYYEG